MLTDKQRENWMPIMYLFKQAGALKIKALTALVGRLSLSVGRGNGHEWGLKTVSFNP